MASEMTQEAKAAVDTAKAVGFKVYRINLNSGIDIAYVRPLTYPEYKGLSATLATVADQQTRMTLHIEKVAELGTVYPKISSEYITKSGAGVVSVIADEILRLSGFTQDIQTEEV